MFAPIQEPLDEQGGLVTRVWSIFFQRVIGTAGSLLTPGQIVIAGPGQGNVETQAYKNGQIPIGDTADGTVAPSVITPGTGIAVVNGPHSITISVTGAGSLTAAQASLYGMLRL